jgi:hypothetical protein
MKLNWGFGIFILYGAFVVFILFLVFRSSQEKVDLVTEDYYQQELEYQEVIAQKNNAAMLDSGLTYSIDKMKVILTFPPQQKDINGKVKLYRASNNNFDLLFDISLNSSNEMEINLKDSPLGLYKMLVSWEANSVKYFIEKDIYLTP